ncbi:MAG: fumarylacetoacetate hydrolase family protein [Gammaproteobacteria bacterium]|nr:fumarylacetoacetate hydrolase family protein [Gammaproteobacteria bacterium]
MKLARFTHKGVTRIGVVTDDAVLDVTAAEPDLPHTLIDVLEAGGPVLATLRSLEKQGASPIPLSDVRLEAPIPRPPKFLAIGLNYADHVAEMGLERPEFPSFFNKQSTCVIGPYDPIHRPRVSTKLDYEGELGFVISRRCRHVPRDRAHEVIAGYLIVNDVTVRDWQARSRTWTLGKSFDTHGPTGPWIVTADEMGDPQVLDIETWVNGVRRQSTNTRHMIFDCYEQVEILSTVFTLEPGDIISTGTSSGVGVKMTPRGYIKAGDVVRVAIEKIGTIENPVIEEPDSTARI